MSGIDLLLRTAIDYERTHHIVLYTLLTKSKMSEMLLNVATPKEIHWEPEGQLFDLAVEQGKTTYIELKMWSSLTDSQLKRQVTFLKEKKSRGVYILLGTSWFEHTGKSISDASEGTASRIGYDEMISSLNQLMVATGQPPEVYELALAYRNAVQEQYNRIHAAYTSKQDEKLYYYAIYHEIQSRLKDMETSIYTVNNPGGPVYILNNSDYWLDFKYDGAEGQLYYEIVNGRLCIKFYVEAPNETKYKLRDSLREAIHKVYGTDYKIVDSGRLGAYMTACQVEYDFTDIKNFEESARIFSDIGLKLEKVLKGIS
jgi:hypothetical protein